MATKRKKPVTEAAPPPAKILPGPASLGETDRTIHVRCYSEDLAMLEEIGNRLGLSRSDAARLMMRAGVGLVYGRGVGEATESAQQAWGYIARTRERDLAAQQAGRNGAGK
jgi:hypothetical protein